MVQDTSCIPSDLGVYHVLSQARLLEPAVLQDYPKVTAFMEAVEALPGIKESDRPEHLLRTPENTPTLFKTC